ncbi:MAG: acetolactate synthase small subunit [Archaeoglobus sp.]|nr:MAG: acetolactate synthase small subunit [Archaeoglobus sp.]
MRHIIAALVENKPGVLARVSSLFRRRGFNIDSLAVGTTEREDISRMTIVVRGDDRTVEQVIKQLNKLVEVVKVSDLSENSVNRILALIKVAVNSENRGEIVQIANIFRARIVDVARDSMIIEITGDEAKIDAFTNLMRAYGIKEFVKTGVVSMARGSKIVEVSSH